MGVFQAVNLEEGKPSPSEWSGTALMRMVALFFAWNPGVRPHRGGSTYALADLQERGASASTPLRLPNLPQMDYLERHQQPEYPGDDHPDGEIVAGADCRRADDGHRRGR